MNTLDDNFNPPSNSNNKMLVHLSRILVIIGVVTIGFALIINFGFSGLSFIAHIEGSSAISIGFRVVYGLGVLLLPFATGIYLVILGNRFNALINDYSTERFSKMLSLNMQLLLTLTLWLIMVTCLVLGYVRM